MKILWLDTETFSPVELKKTGVYPYAEHPETEVMLFTYAIDNAPAQCWDLTQDPFLPRDLQEAVYDPEVLVIAHNAGFDRVILRDVMGIDIPLARWRCSMVKALCHALPGGLDDLGRALGMPDDRRKLTDGKKLINRFCKPAPANHKARRYTRETHPAEWARFVEYAVQDIEAMRDAWHRIPNVNYTADEIALWHLDQEINDRGFLADTELAHAGANAADHEKAILARRLFELTGELIDSPGKRDALKSYLEARFKIVLPDLTKDTLEQMVKRADTDPAAREIMEIRLASNKTSTAKYAALAKAVCRDGRFRGGLQFAGAGRTRRMAGRIFQPQNLPSRGLPPADYVDAYIIALKKGAHDVLFDDLMLFGAASIRGLVIAPPKKKLGVADLSNIEGRLLAWVAGEQWKLEAFRAYDAGSGPDLYNITAVSIIGGDPWKVAKKNRNVFGKVPDLASGYRGGVPGYQQFAHNYGVRMADYWDTIQSNVNPVHIDRAIATLPEPWAQAQITKLGISDIEWLASESCKLAWRHRHPATVEFWKKIEWAAKSAVKNPNNQYSIRDFPGAEYRAQDIRALAKKSRAGDLWLYIRLPSGKHLTYFDPRVVDGEYGETLTYMSLAAEQEGSTSRAWVRTFTHGGKLTGNVCQTLAGDLLKERMPAIEDAGYQIVLTVHDEVVAECLDDEQHGHEDLAGILATNPAWATGLPLAAAGFDTYRYRKD